MSKFSITISADTLDELYASAARFAGSAPTTVDISVDDNGNMRAAAQSVIETLVGGPVEFVPTTPTDPDDQPAADDAPTHDKGGIPWDQRIHSSSRALNEDGSWRKRRGVQDVFYASVMAELTASPSSPSVDPVAVPAAPTAPVVPTPPMAPAVAATPAIPSAPAIPAAPVAPTATAPEPVAASPSMDDGGMEFSDMMPKISAAIHAGKFNNDHLSAWCKEWQLDSVMQLAADRVKTKQFHDWLVSGGLI